MSKSHRARRLYGRGIDLVRQVREASLEEDDGRQDEEELLHEETEVFSWPGNSPGKAPQRVAHPGNREKTGVPGVRRQE